MANPICLSPLKFYDNVNKQNRYRSFAYGHVAPLITNPNVVSPFQLIVGGDVTEVYVRDANTNTRITDNVVERFKEAGLRNDTIKDSNLIGHNVLSFLGVFPLDGILKHQGQYWLEIYAGAWYYSEVFCYDENVENCLKIEYWNPEGDLMLKNGLVALGSLNFHFCLLLRTELGKPEYSFEEEATTRLGYSFVESQVSKKTYNFNAIVPEYICDAMRLIRLCSNKRITSMGEEYEALTFDMTVDWQDQGDLASVDCSFDVDNIIVNLGGFKHEDLGGDFNNDFTNDYDMIYPSTHGTGDFYKDYNNDFSIS